MPEKAKIKASDVPASRKRKAAPTRDKLSKKVLAKIQRKTAAKKQAKTGRVTREDKAVDYDAMCAQVRAKNPNFSEVMIRV